MIVSQIGESMLGAIKKILNSLKQLHSEEEENTGC